MARPNTNYEPRKEALAQAALDLFVDQGYEATTVTQIMRAAGLTKAGMYHYYSSKEEILDAAIDAALGQFIEHSNEEREGKSAAEKMLLFAQGTANPAEMIRKLIRVKESQRDSYAAYRIRERCIYAYIPVMEEILREGVEQGIYRTQYPRQAAEFVVLLTRALVESNLLPVAGKAESALRVRAFLQLCEVWLHPKPAHLAEIAVLFEKELLTTEGE